MKNLRGMTCADGKPFDYEIAHGQCAGERYRHSRYLINCASEQNFVPVIDDKNTFIGLATSAGPLRAIASKPWRWYTEAFLVL